jgi:diamine N-acetyltransferase
MTTIRLAEDDDAPAISAIAKEIHELHVTALPHVFNPVTSAVAPPEDLRELAHTPGHSLLVAVVDDAIVGYAHVMVRSEPSNAYKRASAMLHVVAMGVSAKVRSRGVGHALLAAIRELAVERGLDGLSLEVYAFNGAAKAFYEREGFVAERERMVSQLEQTNR